MDITATTATPSRAAATGAAQNRGSTDYNTFLRMLTTQMQNQDPLNPIESADYAVQLATFSGVEQQTLTNQLMQQLIGAIGGNGLSEHAGWVGKEARSTAPVSFDGRPVTLHVAPSATADLAILSIRNAEGQVVSREEVVLGRDTHVWDGKDMTDAPLPPGRYSFRLESYAGDTLLSDRPVESYARVTEVRSGANGTRVVLAGGVEIAADQITGLREAV